MDLFIFANVFRKVVSPILLAVFPTHSYIWDVILVVLIVAGTYDVMKNYHRP